MFATVTIGHGRALTHTEKYNLHPMFMLKEWDTKDGFLRMEAWEFPLTESQPFVFAPSRPDREKICWVSKQKDILGLFLQ